MNVLNYTKETEAQLLSLLENLCHIPAPSHHEERRAEYLKSYFESMGAKGVYIDKALNVIYPINCEGSREITVFAAHTDTVFPDMEPMPYFDDGERIHCPGVSDDTASVAVLVMMAKYFLTNGIKPQNGIMFVCNSCEEGLGNLKGTRQLFDDFRGRIARFITFDSQFNKVADHCVGSHRYRVTANTRGGHSYLEFGNENAIRRLSDIVRSIYDIDIPKRPGTRTTYNVGEFFGGTSVNTIAQSASMLCEYRSDNKECLEYMEKEFFRIFREAEAPGVEIVVERVGDRPCESIDKGKVEELKDILVPIIEEVMGCKVTYESSSTDCNIPLSLNVPALCIGTNNHYGVHTREEWVEKATLVKGMEIAIRAGLALCCSDCEQ